jgi:hypothetical protein
MKFRGKRIFFEKTGFIFHISHIVLVVYIPYLTKTPLKKRRLHSCPCKILPVVLVADGQSKLIEADHPPDEGTSKVFIGTKSSTSETPICFEVVERSGRKRWPKAITSPDSKGSDTSTISNPRSPSDDSPRREDKPPEPVVVKIQPGFQTSW